MDITTAIRTAYAAATARTGGDGVMLADIRPALTTWTRAEQDAALITLNREPGVSIVPESNQKMLRQDERDAALWMGNQWKHLLFIDQTRPTAATTTTTAAAPAPAKPATVDVEQIAQQLRTCADTDQAAQLVAKLTGRQVTAVAALTGAAVPSSGTVAARRRALVAPVAMRARSQAIMRAGVGSYAPRYTPAAMA